MKDKFSAPQKKAPKNAIFMPNGADN